MDTTELFDRPSLRLRTAIGSFSQREPFVILRRKWLKPTVKSPGPWRLVLKVELKNGKVGWIDGDEKKTK
jgi:hypothetical protein